MSAYKLGLYEKSMPGFLSIKQKLTEAKIAGFDYLELSIDETDEKLSRLNWSLEEIRETQDAVAETGIPIKSICLSGHRRFPLGHPDKKVQEKSLEIMERAIIFSSRLGIRIIQLAGYDVYYISSTDATRSNFERNLRLSVDMAAGEGVILAFETMETDFMNSISKALFWVEKADSPFLQIYPDLGNITNAAEKDGFSVSDDLLKGKGRLSAVHLKETRTGVFREVPYGAGHVDFSTAASLCMNLGVKLFVGEFWYDGGNNWREVLYANNMFLRQVLNQRH